MAVLSKRGEQAVLQVYYEMQALGQDIVLESLLKVIFELSVKFNKKNFVKYNS